MRFYTRKRRNPAPVILPLIDILAILLIFFIVTTTFKKVTPALQINLPESSKAAPAPRQSAPPLVLQITAEETVVLDGRQISFEDLSEAVRRAVHLEPERQLALEADRAAPFGTVVRVMDALRAAGVRQLPALVEPAAAPSQQGSGVSAPPPL